MLAWGYRAFENTGKKFTQRRLRALGCQPAEEDGRYYPPSDSTFQRVLNRVAAPALARLIGYGCGGPDPSRRTRRHGPHTTRESAGRRNRLRTNGTPTLGQG